MKVLKQIKAICDGIEYSRNIPDEAKRIAIENNIVVIVGGSDDLMYCYGAYSYLTDMQEHSCGWDGDTLKDIGDKNLEAEAAQLDLMIWWCGEIIADKMSRNKYDSSYSQSVKESGAFSYSVKKEIESLDFKVMEDNDVYCTGIIIQLPVDFKPSIK